MKQKISVTIDEKTIKIVEQIIKSGIFRNKSHALEQALDSFLKDLKETKNEQ